MVLHDRTLWVIHLSTVPGSCSPILWTAPMSSPGTDAVDIMDWNATAASCPYAKTGKKGAPGVNE
jgi:hypothetical protein